MCCLKFTLVYWKWGSTGVAFWASSIWWSRVSLSSDIDTATSSSPETDNTCIFDELQLSEAAFIFTWHKHVKFYTLRSPRGNSNRNRMLKSSVILQQLQQQQQQCNNNTVKAIPCLFHLHGTWSIQRHTYITLATCHINHIHTAYTRNTFHIQAEEDKLSGLSKGRGDKNAMPAWVRYVPTIDLSYSGWQDYNYKTNRLA